MVWFYLYRSDSPEEVQFPELIVGLHAAMKGYQAGLVGGLGLGVISAFKFGKRLDFNLFFTHTTKMMRNLSVGGLAIGGPLYATYDFRDFRRRKVAERTPSGLHMTGNTTLESAPLTGRYMDKATFQRKAFAIQHSKWQNRTDCLTLYGMVAGQLCSRPQVLHGLLGFTGVAPIPLGGMAWGSLLALAFDVPLSILLPNYWAHNEDVDFIVPDWVGLEED